MHFSSHRSNNGNNSCYDSDVDSLWSDSDEAVESSVKPLKKRNQIDKDEDISVRNDDDDISTPPSSDTEDESFRDYAEQRIELLRELKPELDRERESSLRRNSILSPIRNGNTSINRILTSTPGGNNANISSTFSEGDSFSSDIISSPSLNRKMLNQAKVKSDYDKLDSMANRWNMSNIERYSNSVREDEISIEEILTNLSLKHEEDVSFTEKRTSEIIDRRNKRVAELMNERTRREEEEKERKRLEEERRILKLREEEERRKEQEEKIRREEEERIKHEQEEKILQEEKKKKQLADAAANAKQQEEAALAKAASDAKLAKEQKLQQQKELERKRASTRYTDWKLVESEFVKYKTKIQDIKDQIVRPVADNPDLRKYCFQNKRHVKVKIGQLTDSRSNLQKCFREVCEIFEAAKVFNELTFLWLLNFFAKSVVEQAETETIVAIQSAVPLGAMATFCMAKYPQLVELIIARFVKKCPQVIGYSCKIDTEEGMIRMGYKRRNDKWEEETSYSERISGMCSVWTVITMTEQLKSTPFEHPYPFSNSWKFLARQLNKDPQLLQNADYAAVAAWWDVASETFVRVYGRQGVKLLQAASTQWPTVTGKRYPAALRLLLLGEDWQKTNRLTTLVAPMGP